MENRSHAIIAVSFLVIFAFGVVTIFWWLRSGKPETRVYEIVSDYAVGGLQPQATVKFMGLLVGHVTDIEFDPRNPKRILIRIGVHPDAYITHATYAQLGYQGITGMTFITLALDSRKPETPLTTNPNHPARIPMHQGLLADIEASGTKDLQRIAEVLERVNRLLNEENTQHLSSIIAQLDQATRKLVRVEEALLPTLGALPPIAKEMQQNLRESQQLLHSIHEVAVSAQGPVKAVGAAAASVEVLSRTSDALARKLTEDTLPRLDALTKNIGRTADEVERLSRELQAQPQSLLFGASPPPPGPGEPGFHPPTRER